MRWNLDALYDSFEGDGFKREMVQLAELIEKASVWSARELESAENAVSKIETYIDKSIEISMLQQKLSHFAELTVSVDAKNEVAKKFVDKIDKMGTELTGVSVKFMKWLGGLNNLNQIISDSERLGEHRFFLNEIVEKTKHILSEKEEVAIAKMRTTGSTAWGNLWNNLTAGHMVDLVVEGEEKTLPLAAVRNLYYDKNPDSRKNAYEAELKSYKSIEESAAACLNAVKGEVITTAGMKGYESPLAMTLFNSRMDEETLNAMLDAMRESFPVIRKFFRKKAEMLGHKNGLPFFDIFAPIGSSDITFSYEEARKFIVDNFRKFSPEMADFADMAFEQKWIDAEPREGKRGGAFCANLRCIKESRVLANFSGSFSSVTTIAHELGHAFHGHCLNDETILNCHYPMPLAETASILCETIVTNAALETASKEDALSILENDLSSAGQVVVDIYSRFMFESELFERRKEAALSVDELKEVMLDAQKKAYGDGLDPDFLHPYMWLNKPHYYYADYNFYNFPYAFGLLFAKGLYAEYLKRGSEFVEDYKKLLAVTGKEKIADVTNMIGINVRKSDFWRSSLKLIEKDVEKFLTLS